MRFGLLTGGGDSSAINAAVRSIVLTAIEEGHEVIAIRDGWRGALDNRTLKLTHSMVARILHLSGTIIGTSRTNPLKEGNGIRRVLATLKKHKIDCLITIGGDDTLGVCHMLADAGVKAVGIPQTIDNDIGETDYSIGYDTALNFVMESLDRLRATASSHSRVMVVEIMGRDAGWLALLGGLAGGADVILIPEVKFVVDDILSVIRSNYRKGKRFCIIAASEGARPAGNDSQISKSEEVDEFGHIILGGIGDWLGGEIKRRTKFETRVAVLGHLQRGGAPTAFDRNIATRFGTAAVMACLEGLTDSMVSLKSLKVTTVPLKKALKKNRVVDIKTLTDIGYFFRRSLRDSK